MAATMIEPLRVAFEPFIDGATREFIINSLDSYSFAATGRTDYLPINYVLRGERGDVLGGLLGQVWASWRLVTHLWVADAARGLGNGTRLLLEAEAYARARGAISATLETHSFQARPFYEKLGYELYGTLDGYPPDHAKYFLRKALG